MRGLHSVAFACLVAVLLAGVSGASGVATVSGYEGCYRVNLPVRQFGVSPGNYNVSLLTPALCQTQCGDWGFRYAALTQARFCFCGNEAPLPGNKDEEDACSVPCAGDPSLKCGGVYHVSVYESRVDIQGLKLAPLGWSGDVVEVGQVIQFQASYQSGPATVYFRLDAGDGSQGTPTTNTDLEVTFALPGEHVVRLHAAGDQTMTQVVSTSMRVLAQSPVRGLAVTCPEVALVGEEVRCELQVQEASLASGGVNYGDNVTETFPIAGPWFERVGAVLAAPIWLKVTGKLFLMPGSEFTHSGKLTTFHFQVTTGGTLDLLVLEPSCPTGKTYCFSQQSCVSDPASCPPQGVFSCAGTATRNSAQFCPAQRACVDTCASSSRHTSGQISLPYKVKHQIKYYGGAGTQVMKLTTALDVEAGDILGYFPGSSDLTTLALTTEPLLADAEYSTDLLPTNPIPPGDVTSAHLRHFLSAVVARPTHALFMHKFQSPGDYTLEACVTNDIQTSSASQQVNIRVLQAINPIIIKHDGHAATGSETLLEILPQEANYTWEVNGEIFQTTDPELKYTFPSRGAYVINVTAANQVDRKWNTSVITVEDAITNLGTKLLYLEPGDKAEVTVTMATGSDFSCEFNCGDGKTESLDRHEGAMPQAGLKFSHTYSEFKGYSANVTCSNKVSKGQATLDVKIQQFITHLNLTSDSIFAKVGHLVKLSATIETGTSVKLEWNGTLVGQEYSATTGLPDQFTSFDSPGSHVVSLKATNIHGTVDATITIHAQLPVTRDFDVTSNSPVKYPTGEVSVSVILPNSHALPTDAKVTLSCKDGGRPEVVKVTAHSLTLTHVCQPGEHDGVVTISNMVSSESFPLPIRVYTDITDVKVSATYRLPGTAQGRLGGGDNGDQFPVQYPVRFAFTVTGGAVTSYRLRVLAPGIIDKMLEATSSPVAYTFTQPGPYIVTCTALNPVSQASVDVNVVMVTGISGLNFTDKDVISAPGDVKTLWLHLETYSDNSCVHVDLGDGSPILLYGRDADTCKADLKSFVFKEVLSPEVVVTHVYTKEGTYEVTVSGFEAEEPDTRQTALVEFPATKVDCRNPVISIWNSVADWELGRGVLRKDRLKVMGVVDALPCVHTKLNVKSWRVQRLDPDTGGVVAEVDLGPWMSGTVQLELPANFLQYGPHRITFTVTMDPAQFPPGVAFRSSLSTHVTVLPSPPVARLVLGGVTQVAVGQGQTFTLDPDKYSIFPDQNDVTSSRRKRAAGDQGLFKKYDWYCRSFSPQQTTQLENVYSSADKSVPLHELRAMFSQDDGSACLKGQAGLTGYHGTRVELTTSSFEPDTAMGYLAVLETLDGTTSAAAVMVDVVSHYVPIVHIMCENPAVCQPAATGLRVNPSENIAVTGGCDDACMLDDSATYQWILEAMTPTGQWTSLSDNFSGQGTKKVVVRQGAFSDMGSLRTLRLCLVVTSKGRQGKAYVLLVPNPAPSGGKCSVARPSEMPQNQPWNVSCEDWVDDDGIKWYQLFARFENESAEVQLAAGDEGYFRVGMPLGAEWDQYRFDLRMRITDNMDACTVYEFGKIELRPLSKATLDGEISTLLAQGEQSPIHVLGAKGNVQETTRAYNGILEILNGARRDNQLEFNDLGVSAVSTPTHYGPSGGLAKGSHNQENKTAEERQAEYESQRNNRAQLREEMWQYVSALPSHTPEDLAASLSTTCAITQATEELPRTSLLSMADWADNVGSRLVDLAGNIPPSQTLELVTSLLALTGNVLEATTVGITQTALVVDEESVDAIYETFWESEEERLVDLPLDVAEVRLRVEDNVNEQKRTTSQIVTQFAHVLVSAAYVLRAGMARGDTQQVSTRGLDLLMVAASPGNVTGAHSSGRTRFQLPDWSAMGAADAGLDTVFMEATSTPTNPYVFCRHGRYVPRSSSALGIDLRRGDGDVIRVSNTDRPIIIRLPRDPTVQSPEPVPSGAPLQLPEGRLMVFHSGEVTEYNASITVEIFPTGATSTGQTFHYLVVLRFGDFPNITAGTWDFANVVTRDQRSEEPRYAFFLSNTDVNNRRGKVYVGIRQITALEAQEYTANHFTTLTQIREAAVFSSNFSSSIFSSSCLYYLPAEQDMSAAGCNVTSETTWQETVCACSHLTSFASGWVVVPNTIDWDFVFSNADFLKNPTLYVTEIVIAVLYLLVAIWARRQDKKDLLKVGLTPLADNNPQDRYMYEVVVNTGMRSGASTDSKVYIVFSGEWEDTDARELADDKRRLFRRGETNHFLMTTSRPLGALTYARVWHDNSGRGKAAGWYLNYVVVQDLQTQQRFSFICNRWLAVEEDDGQVSRVLPVAGPEQLLEFGHLFGQKTRRQLADGHLWFSVLGRPPQSRFTRLQRVSCCLCLLFTSMLANAMFYERGSGSKPFTLGPFALSPEQIFIGVASNLVVFPVNLIIITLFRRSRARRKRVSRIQEALNLSKHKHAEAPPGVQNSGAPARPVTANSWMSTSDLDRLDNSVQNEDEREARQEERKKKNRKQKKKKWSLPWWCVGVAWALLWMAVATCVAFVTFYGIMFQDVKCKKWITSMLVSFISSIFLTQPIKVLLLAIVFSLIFKKAEDEEEEEEGVEDEEEMKTQWDEEWLHADPYNQGYSRPRRAAYTPPDPEALEKARLTRMQELRMYDVIREVAFYAVFLWVLMVASYGFRDPKAYAVKTGVENILINKGAANYSDFTKMRTVQHLWLWMRQTLLPGVRAGIWYNGRQPIGERGFMADRVSRVMGYATVRQLRSKDVKCEVPDMVASMFPSCQEGYDILKEDTADYGPGWKPLTANQTCSAPYCYRDWQELDGLPYAGQRALYSGGGYAWELRGSVKHMEAELDALERHPWVDRRTRALFVEMTGYNAFVNLFCITTLLVELLPTGGLILSYRVDAVNLLDSLTSGQVVTLVCQVVFVAFIFFFLVKEVRRARKEGRAYLRQFWTWVEVMVILLAITAVALYVYRLVASRRLTARFRETHGNEYMKFQGVGYWNELLTYIVGWLVFLATVKFLRLLRFNRRMAMLASTLRHGSRSMAAFGIMFVLFFFAFIQLFYLVFGPRMLTFATPIGTAETLLQVTLGDFDFHAMKVAYPELAGPLFLVYVCVMTFILVNMFVSILNESFTAVRSDIAKQSNEYEVVDFMVKRFKTWVGLGPKPGGNQGDEKDPDALQYLHYGGKPLDGTTNPYELEPRLDEFFERIGDICFEGNPFDKKALAAHSADGGLKKANLRAPKPRKPSLILLDMERELGGASHI